MNDFIREMLFLPEAASTYAEHVDRLHIQIIGVTMVSFFGLLIAT